MLMLKKLLNYLYIINRDRLIDAFELEVEIQACLSDVVKFLSEYVDINKIVDNNKNLCSKRIR